MGLKDPAKRRADAVGGAAFAGSTTRWCARSTGSETFRAWFQVIRAVRIPASTPMRGIRSGGGRTLRKVCREGRCGQTRRAIRKGCDAWPREFRIRRASGGSRIRGVVARDLLAGAGRRAEPRAVPRANARDPYPGEARPDALSLRRPLPRALRASHGNLQERHSSPATGTTRSSATTSPARSSASTASPSTRTSAR